MKTLRNLIVAASAAVLSLAGCQEEIFNQPVESDNYYASAEAFTADTKTALGQGRSVVWSSGDQIAIFEGTSSGKAYQVVDAAVGSNSGEFTLVGDLCTDATSEIEGNTIAVYPFNKSLTASAGENDSFEIGGIKFPSRQAYTSGSFSDEAFPMAALTQEGSKSLLFRNIGGVIKLSLTGSCSVREISLHGHSDEPLSGHATVILGPDGIPSVNMSSEASKSVTLVCDPAIQLDSEKATDFFISIPPTEFKAGFTVTITDSEGNESTKSTDKANNVLRSTILAMPGFSQDVMEEVTYTISEIAEDVVNIDEYVSPIFSECDNIGQLSQHLGNIQRIDGVKEAWTTNSALVIRTRGGFTMSWMYPLDGNSEEIYETETASKSEKRMFGKRVMTKSSSYDTHDSGHDYHNVCIINQQFDQENRKGYLAKYDTLAMKFENSGFGKVERIDGAEANLDFFKNSFTKYDIIFLITHGYYDDKYNNHWIATGEEWGIKEGVKKFIEDIESILDNESIKNNEFEGIGAITIPGIDKYYIGFCETFVNKTMEKNKNFDNAIIFNVSCQSLMDNDRLADAFLNKGAAVYLGYNESNSVGQAAGLQFFDSMVCGMTIEEAYNSLKEDYKKELIKYSFPFDPVYSNLEYQPTSCKDICIAHLTPETLDTTMVNGKVKFNGTFKTPVKGYHVDCNLGFCYSNSTNEPTIENGETIFVENGNDPITDGMVYSADMSDIEYNTTYYYRFFFQNPHSGEYVYGDTQSFKLEMDKWVDLGLPSGILWAAWNVGANSPEEYGGYYAWGETEEKSNYLDYYEYEFYDSWYGSFDYLGSVISGTKYDVAHVKWGDGARMPTYYDFDELIANCTKEVDTYNGVNGVYLTGPNGNSIFIPFSGDRAVNFTKEGESGVLWTGTYGKDSTGKRLNACCVFCRGASIYLRNDIKRTFGMTVRPVKSK